MAHTITIEDNTKINFYAIFYCYEIQNQNVSTINSNMAYKSGDTIGKSNTMMWLTGTLTTSNKEIFVFAPVNKPMVGSSIKFNLINFVIRQNGIYLYNSYSSGIDNIKVTTIVFPNSGLYFKLIKEDGWGGTNHDVVSVRIVFTVTIS